MQTVREIMTTNPVTADKHVSLAEAARMMRDADIGDVLVTRSGLLAGLVTDRDLVVRGIAEGKDPETTGLAEVCSTSPVTLSPDDPVDDAVRMMRHHAIRRLPVVEDDRPVGVVSLGDLATERDPKSALAEISSADPNV